jgi:tetratricopeptide (TPR) repeat protein
MARENEKSAQYQYEKAIVAMKYGLVEKSIKYLNQALSLDPNHYQSYNLLGLAYFKKQNFGESASAYQRFLELQPEVSEVHNRLGFVYQEMGFLDKAEEGYKKAYSIDSNYDASFNLAKLYFEQNKLELALDYVQNSILKNTRSSRAYNLGIAYINNKEFNKARLLLDKILPLVQDQTLKDKINEYLNLIKERLLLTP